MIIDFEQVTPEGRHDVRRVWGNCPRIGESVDFDQEGDRKPVRGMRGRVVSVCWWSNGRARVVLEPRSDR